jgi:hypothetical protein
MERLLNFLIHNGKSWIIEERETNRRTAVALSKEEKVHLQPHFKPETLDSVRVRRVGQIKNPDFYSVFLQAGQQIPLDFAQMVGITFIDTIVIAESKVSVPNWIPLIFHECVHVFQYQHLGVAKFVEEYVMGWARNGFDYYKIPLEQQAYQLQSQFITAPQVPLDVETKVKTCGNTS